MVMGVPQEISIKIVLSVDFESRIRLLVTANAENESTARMLPLNVSSLQRLRQVRDCWQTRAHRAHRARFRCRKSRLGRR